MTQIADQLRGINRPQWPTPTATMYNLNESPEEFLERAEFWKQRKGYHNSVPLVIAVKMWPTPTASDGGSNNNSRAVRERGHGTNLAGAVKAEQQQRMFWPTPNARDWKDTPGMAETGADGRNRLDQLARVVYHEERKMWPTPLASHNRKSTKAMTASENNARRSGGGNSSPPGLEQAVEIAEGVWPKEMPEVEKLTPATREMVRTLWPTPRARDADKVPSGHRGNSDSLNASVARAEDMQVQATGKLNPTWVEWLMGFPLGWTDLEDSATR